MTRRSILTRLAAWLGITREPPEHALNANGFAKCARCIWDAEQLEKAERKARR